MKRPTEYKAFPFFVKEISERTVKQIFAVMGNVDGGNDILWNGAFLKTLQERMDMVQVLWQHDGFAPPVGVPQLLKEIGRMDLPAEITLKYPEATGALYGEIEYLETPRGDEILRGIQKNAIKKNSIGYYAIKADFSQLDGVSVRNLREVALMDVSAVNWGMNEATTNLKAALPYRDCGKADMDTAWSAPSLADFTDKDFDELNAKEARRVAEHFAWSANVPPEAFGDLKLGHHAAQKNGVGPAVWKGVAAAMGALLGARGGVDLPEGDRKAVYDHLAAHYEEFEKTPPDFKFVETCYYAAKIGVVAFDVKEGRVFSSENVTEMEGAVGSMREAIERIQKLIDKATPAKMADARALARRGRALELAIALR